MASVKYFLTFPYALIIGLNFTQAVIAITIGGIAGFYFFYYFSGVAVKYYKKHKEKFMPAIRKFFRGNADNTVKTKHPAKKPVFSKRNRYIVRLKKSCGLWGIITITPIFLSIPIGAFLLNKYYSKQKYIFAYMVLSIVGWSLILCSIVIIFPTSL